MKYLMALAMVLCLGFTSMAAFGCTQNDNALLNEYHVVSCIDATANSTCYAVVSETDSGLLADYAPETAFNDFKESWYASPDGGLAYAIRIKPDIYKETYNYTITTYCADGSTTDTFIVGSFQPSTQLLGSITKWMSENAILLVVAVIAIIFLAVMAVWLLRR